jgi:acetylornithine/N-succinyldiaminopimelate aminotransferase
VQSSAATVKGHPFPKQYAPELLVIRRGRGVWLEDAAGRRYLDFAGGIAVNALGYGRADLARAAARQMRKLSHISNLFANEPALALARSMIARGPFPFSAVFFGNSGTEANEAALKYARLHAARTRGPGQHRLHCFSHAFHGRTMGALSCTPNPKYQDPFLPLVPGISVSAYNDVAALQEALADDVAGVIVEVVQGEGGLAAMTAQFAKALNEGCRKHNAILIADEVQTGLARTGTFYASEGVGLQPDIITLAKPLAGGLPLSAALLTAKIDSLLHVGDHGTTFGGGPVTTAVALKVWEVLSRPGFADEVAEKGAHLRAGLERLKSRVPSIGELRGKGLLQGFEYTGTGSADPMQELLARFQGAGLLVLRSGANVVRLAPPLVITEKEIDRGITIMEEALT